MTRRASTPGSTAAVNIIVKQLNNVTEVPTAAISYNSSGQATVTQVVNGAHVVKPVTVGPAQSGETQITSGVTAGDKVVEQVISFRDGPGGTGGGLFGGTGGRFGGARWCRPLRQAGGFPAGGFGGGGGRRPRSTSAAADDRTMTTPLPRRGRRPAW